MPGLQQSLMATVKSLSGPLCRLQGPSYPSALPHPCTPHMDYLISEYDCLWKTIFRDINCLASLYFLFSLPQLPSRMRQEQNQSFPALETPLSSAFNETTAFRKMGFMGNVKVRNRKDQDFSQIEREVVKAEIRGSWSMHDLMPTS